jgi:uncharacterized protein YbbC (DUF1343 family)
MFRKWVVLLFFLCTFTSFPIEKYFPYPKIKLGIDVLIEQDFYLLDGKRVGLVANSASRASDEKLTAEHFALARSFQLVAIFTPEHGFYATFPAGQYVFDDSIYGVPVFSLYGNNRKPTPWQMSLLDIVVIDLQDIGIRSYTYISTMFKVMEAAVENGKQVIVLDRPNPLGGNLVDGNVLEKSLSSFVGIAPIPYIYGMTIGELATMFNEEGWLQTNGNRKRCDLFVVKMENWQRSMKWEDTGLNWFPTSPNIPSVDAIRGAAMLGIFGELRMFNLGIGTNSPLQFIGVTGKNFNILRKELESLKLDGVKFKSSNYKNLKPKSSNLNIKGYLVTFDKNKDLKLYSYGWEIIFAVRRALPELFNEAKISHEAKNMFIKVTGTRKLFDALFNGDGKNIQELLKYGLTDFLQLRSKYLLYK